MTYVMSRPSPERAGAQTVGRGHIEGLPTPWPIAEHLPGALQEDDLCVRMMAAFDDVMAPIFGTLDCFDAYLDPRLAPEDFVEWLASWVGVEIDETWTLDRRRQLIREAVVLYRMRGTVAGLAAHVRLYAGVGPEIEESGACAWSQTADHPLPGRPTPGLTVRVHVDEEAGVRQPTLSRIVAASRPAHVPYQVEIVIGGTAVESPVESVADEVAPDAPGAVDLPGSDHIELAPQAPSDVDETEPGPGGSAGGQESIE